MNKIIPIICLIVASLGAVIATVGIITIAVATRVSGVGVVAVPAAIIGAVLSGLSACVTAMFFRDRLCKIAFFINIAALVISAVSIIIWLTIL